MSELTRTAPVLRPLAPSLAAPPASPWRALPVLLSGTFLIVLDFFIVNVALPSLQADLHAGATALEWVVAGYGLSFAVLLVAAGRVGDRVGRRRVFTAGVGSFTAASAVCGVAPTAGVLVAARVAQGVGAAMISATVLAIIGVLFTGAERAKAVSVYATVMGVAAASGQLLGGLLLHADVGGLGWRLVFLVNVPVGLLALATVRRTVPESRAERAAAVDVVGLALLSLGLTALVLPLVDGRAAGWPWWSFASLAAAPLALGEFALRQRRAAAPLLDPALLREPTFTAGMLTQLAFWCGQASYFLVLALYLQLGRGLSAMASGLVFSILAGAYLLASMRAPALAARYGRRVVVAGALLLAAGHGAALLATADVGVGGPVLLLAPGLVLAGTGMGLCIAPITTTVLSHVEPQRAGAVSGALSTVQQVGNAVGVAVIGLVFFGAAPSGYDRAFEESLAALAVLLLGVAGCARRLPGRPG